MMAHPASETTSLKQTPLHALHLELGARMAPFAGYEMPIHFALGVLKEHQHTRAAAGLFDVSHMGQIILRPRSGRIADVATALERLVPIDILGLQPGRQRYAFFTNDRGGIIDDLMVGHCDNHLALIVNASRKEVDERIFRDGLSDACTVEVLQDRALLALQGPSAEEVMMRLSPPAASMRFMDVRPFLIAGMRCLVSRSGYTGEDGFEISIRAQDSEKLARILLHSAAVAPIGLGARDSLRIESGLCLYGSDIDESTTPVEARLEWAIPKIRRHGGARAGNFSGADVVLRQFDRGASRHRIGLKPRDRTPVRGGALLYAAVSATEPIGTVTSGTFGPTVAGPVAMGYVSSTFSKPNTLLFADVRSKRLPVEVTELPFVPHRYKRS